MNVSELSKYLLALCEPIRASGGTKVAADLATTIAELEKFDSMSINDFSILMHQANEYRNSGILPIAVAKSGKRSSASNTTLVSEHTIKAVAQELSSLYERSIDESCDYSYIEAELKKLDKRLSKQECDAVLRELGRAVAKTKKQGLDDLKHWLFQRKESFEKTRF